MIEDLKLNFILLCQEKYGLSHANPIFIFFFFIPTFQGLKHLYFSIDIVIWGLSSAGRVAFFNGSDLIWHLSLYAVITLKQKIVKNFHFSKFKILCVYYKFKIKFPNFQENVQNTFFETNSVLKLLWGSSTLKPPINKPILTTLTCKTPCLTTGFK